MFRFLLTCLVVALASSAVWADGPPIPFLVVTPDGKPAAGAKAWAYDYADGKEAAKEPTSFTTDAAGKFSVPPETGAPRMRYLFVRDSAGRVGYSSFYPRRDDGDAEATKVTLLDTAACKGRILSADGKPVAGAVVAPALFSTPSEGRSKQGLPEVYVDVPVWERARLAVKTDAEGRFALPAVPGCTIQYSVKADGRETKWYAPPGVELETKFITPGKLTIRVAGVDPAALKDHSWNLRATDNQPDSKTVLPVRWQSKTFDGSATVTVDALPGRYELIVYTDGRVPALPEKSEPVEVESGKEATLTAKFGPAAKVTGKVVDKATGQGIANVQVMVSVSDSDSPNARYQYSVETDKDGHYAVYGGTGWYIAWLQTSPEGYSTPPRFARQSPERVKVEIGKSHTLATIELPKSVTFSGQVVFPDGKPAAGALVSVGTQAFDNNQKVTTDKDGNFSIKNLPPDDAVAPRVRLGKAVNVPETFELEKATKPVSIEISEANAVGFKGQILDTNGKPIAGAKVVLRQMIWGVGRHSGYGSYVGPAKATTDAEGRYSFDGLWPRDRYSIHVTADGYAAGEVKDTIADKGEEKEFATLKLARTSLSVIGVVVGADGQPVAGAEVFSVDGPKRVSIATAADGTFTLAGFYDRAAFLFAKKAGYRLTAVPVTPGAKDRVTVTLAKADEPVAQPEVTAAHRAALDKFTRHALTLVWESHPTFGYGGNALEAMARIDLETARKWREQEMTRTNGKTDFNRLINRVVRNKELFTLAKDDLDEALAVLQGMKADDGYSSAMELGDRMLPLDKAKAARCAEEAVVKARQIELPNKLYTLAQAGNLAARAGNVDGGKKVMLEAAEQAEKLTAEVNSRNTLAIGLVAANLAPYDWAKAESLLGLLKDNGEYNRFLSASAARVAAIDLAKAKPLLDKFKPSNSFYPSIARLRVAFAIAKEKPDEAMQLVEGVKEATYRFEGYIRLARLFAPTDKPRAFALINTAFDLLERDAEPFRTWGGMSGRAGLAAVGTVRAKEIGYPDVAALVARTLALRPTGQDNNWSPQDREHDLVNIAAVLAFVDPPTARHILAGIAPPDEFLAKALSQRRDWLFGLALADPERATELADKVIEQAKVARGGRNGLSGTGLVELGSILTADDRLALLTMFGSLPREIDDRD